MDSFPFISIGLVMILSGLGYAEARRLMRRYPEIKLETIHKSAKYIYGIVAIVAVAFPAMLIPMNSKTAMWHAPMWVDLFGVELLFTVIICCFSFLFSLVAFVAIKTRHKEAKGIALASVLIILAFPLFQYQYTHPVYPELKEKSSAGFVLQSHSSTCAAASGANIARALGIIKSEREMARLMNTSAMMGTSAGQVMNGMKQVGISCSKKWVKDQAIDQIKAPAMFFIDNKDIGPESHAVMFVGMQGDQAGIMDPLEGQVLYSKNNLNKIWHGKSLECALQ